MPGPNVESGSPDRFMAHRPGAPYRSGRSLIGCEGHWWEYSHCPFSLSLDVRQPFNTGPEVLRQ